MKKYSLFLLAILSFSSYSCNICPKGFEGQDCSIEVTPKKIWVTHTIVQKFQGKKTNGTDWDPGAAFGDELPDIIMAIVRTSEQFAGSFVANADPAGVPYTISFAANGNGSYSKDLTSLFKLRFYDFDFSAGDEFMAEMGFYLYENGMGFPDTIRAESEDGLYVCDLVLEYEH